MLLLKFPYLPLLYHIWYVSPSKRTDGMPTNPASQASAGPEFSTGFTSFVQLTCAKEAVNVSAKNNTAKMKVVKYDLMLHLQILQSDCSNS